MTGFPVVIAENGLGIPVIPVEENAPSAVIAENGLGAPIVLVEKNGTPLIIEGLYEPEAMALFARMTVQPDATRKSLINTLIKALKTAGVWSKLDVLYVMAAHDAQAARRNWIADSANLTPVSSPTFTADRGYAGDGAASYLNTGFAPGSAARLLQDDASIFGWARAAMTARHGSFDGTRDLQLRSDTATNLRGIVNSAENAGISVTIPSNVGYLGNDRRNGTTVHAFSAGINRGSVAINSVGRSTQPLYIGARNANGVAANFNAVQMAAFGAGASLGDAGHLALYNALNTFLQAVGAVA